MGASSSSGRPTSARAANQRVVPADATRAGIRSCSENVWHERHSDECFLYAVPRAIPREKDRVCLNEDSQNKLDLFRCVLDDQKFRESHTESVGSCCKLRLPEIPPDNPVEFAGEFGSL